MSLGLCRFFMLTSNQDSLNALIMCTLLWGWQAAALQRDDHDATPLLTEQDIFETELRNFRLELAKSEKMLLGKLPVTMQRPSRSVDITASNMYHPFSFPTDAGSHRDIVVEQVVVDQSFNLSGLTDLEYLEYNGQKFITMVTGNGKAEVYQLNMTTGHFNWTAELDISGESVKQLRYFSAVSNCFGEADPDVRLYCAVLSDYTLRIYHVIMPFFFLLETPVQTLHFSSQTKGLHLFHTPQEGPTDSLFLLVLLEKGAMVPTVKGQLTVPVYRWQRDKHSQCMFQHMSHNPVVPETGQDAESFLINSEMFMVIAHHSDSKGEVVSQSTVLKYNSHKAVFQHLQSLHVEGAVDVEYFRIGQDPYLALAAHSSTAEAATGRLGEMQPSYIFKWNGYNFELLQTIAVDGGQKFESILIPSSEETKLLALVHHGTDHSPHTSIFQYSNQYRQFKLVHQQLPVGLDHPADVPADIVSFAHHGKSYLAVAHTNWTMLCRLEVAAQLLPSLITVEKQKILDSITELKQNMSELTSNVQALAARVAEDPVTKMGDQVISGTKTFTGNVTIRHLVAKNITVVGTTVVDVPETERSMNEKRLISLETIKAQVGAQHEAIQGILGRLQDAVPIDKTQKVPIELVLQDKVFLNGDLSAQKVTMKTINGINISQLQQEIVRLDREVEIMGSMAVHGDVVIMGNVNVSGKYNGVDLSIDAMTVATPQTITGLVTFSNNVTVGGDIELTGMLNSVDLSEDVVTLAGNHSITGKKTFLDDLYFRGDIVMANDSTVDNVDIVELSNNVMTIQGDQIITGAKTVTGNLILDGDLTITGSVNDIDISDMDERVIKLDEPVDVTGHKIFENDVTVYGDIELSGRLNDVDLYEDLVILRGPGVMTGYKMFSRNVTVLGDLYVTGTVDGTYLSEDVVTLTGDHNIDGIKTFSGGMRIEDVTVAGMVDGVNLRELQENVVTLTTDQVITGPFTFASGVNITENMQVSGEVDGVDLSDLAEDAIYVNYPDVQEVEGQKIFSEDVNVTEELTVTGTINGFNLEEDFVHSTDNQTITGHKIFIAPVTIYGDLTVKGTIDGVNLTKLLQDMVTLSGDQIIRGHKTFTSSIFVENNLIMCEDCRLNGIDLSDDAVLLNSSQTITGTKVFQNGMVVEGALAVEGCLHVERQVNAVNLSYLADNRVTLSTDQVIMGRKTFYDEVTVEGDAVVDGTVNGLHLQDFVQDMMLSSTTQTVTGRKEFLGQVTVEGDVMTNGTVDGEDISELMEEVIYLDKEQHIKGNKVFTDPVVIQGDLFVKELVNGVNITDLQQDMVYSTRAPQIITGTTTFLDGFHVEGDIHVLNMVQGMDISEELWTVSTDQVIRGHYVFQSNVTVHQDVEIQETVNGLNLSKDVLQWMTLDDPQDVYGDIRFEDTVFVKQDLQVTGTINGLDISKCVEDAVMVSGDKVISGTKHFLGHVTVHGDLLVENVNEVNLTDFVGNIVTISGDEEITGNKTFLGEVVMNSTVTVHGNMWGGGRVDGVDLTLMQDEAIYLDKQQQVTGCKSFSSPDGMAVEGNIVIHGKVNSIIMTDVAMTSGAQVITGQKTFLDGIKVEGSIQLKGLLDGVNLVEVEADSLKVSGKQVVRGRKVFLSDVTVTGDVIMTDGVQLNGWDVSEEAVTLHTDQRILASKSFHDKVVVQGDIMVYGQVAEQDLVKLMMDPRLMSDQTIYGNVAFRDVVFQQEVFIDGAVNGVNLEKVTQDQQTCYNTVHYQTVELQEKSLQQCQDMSTLHYTAEDAMEVIHHFVWAQSFPLPAARSFHSFDMEGETWLTAANFRDDSGFCTSSPLYSWDVTSSQFVQTDSKVTNGARAWHYFNITDSDHSHHFLVIANQALQSCPKGLSANVSQLFKYNVSMKAFTPYQSLTTHGAKDFVSFRLGTDTYLAVANSHDVGGGGRSTIFKFNQEDQQFELHWSIPTAEAVSVDAFKYNGTQFLVYANSKLFGELQTQVFVYDDEQSQFQASQIIPTSSAADVVHFVLAGLPHLVVADMYEVGLAGINNYNMHIKVYRWSQDRSEFVWTQTMHFEAASDVAVFHWKNNIYLAAVSLNTAVTVYRHKGVSGFLPVVTIPAHGARSVQPLSIGSQLFLAVAQDPLDTIGQGSTLFKAVMAGFTMETVGGLQCDTMWMNGTVGQLPDQD